MRINTFYVAEGVENDQSPGFAAAAMRIDNPTNGWVLLDGQYQAGPLSFGYVQNINPALQNARITVTLTSPGGVVATGNGQTARIIYYDVPQEPAAGSYQQVTAAISVTAGTQEQVRSGAGVSTDVGYRAADLAQPVYLLSGAAGNSAQFGTNANPMQVGDAGGSLTVDVGTALPAGNNNIGDVDIASLPNEGQQTMANSISVAVASDQSRLPVENGPYSYSRRTTEGQVKATAGFIHSVSIAPLTATPTAGLLTIYDDPAESGNIVYSEWVFATGVGHTIVLDVTCASGIFVGFDGTLANVSITTAYR